MNHVDPTEAERREAASLSDQSHLSVVFAALVVLTLAEVGVAYIEGGIKAPLLLGMSAIRRCW